MASRINNRCALVKALDMVTYLSTLGYEPAKIRNNDYWYCSPLHNERTASFKVNRAINRWYDHGIGKGGNLIDFGVLYFNCTVSYFLQKFPTGFFFQQPPARTPITANPAGRIIVLDNFIIGSPALTKYLSGRNIPVHIAEKFCKEVRFQIKNKTYYAIGFKNDAGGFELRNAFMKTSSTPKAVTSFKNGHRVLCVFEGFFDFLSYISMAEKQAIPACDYLILNSLSFFEQQLPFMEKYDHVELYLDNDSSGQNCSRIAVKRNPVFSSKTGLYNGYNDLNDWWSASNNDDS